MQGITAAPPRVLELLTSPDCTPSHGREPSAALPIPQIEVEAVAGPVMVRCSLDPENLATGLFVGYGIPAAAADELG